MPIQTGEELHCSLSSVVVELKVGLAIAWLLLRCFLLCHGKHRAKHWQSALFNNIDRSQAWSLRIRFVSDVYF